MFYLLEDNRIITDEEKMKDLKKAFTSDKELNIEKNKTELRFVYVNDRGIKHIVSKYKIKKQSENVFDLVNCCQDLIETEEGQFYKPLKLQIDSFVVKYDCCVLFDGIKAIYKPDDKGNYIKVWEE